MTAPRRLGFSRLETDAELLRRILAKRSTAGQSPYETLDQFADREGLCRRIVEDDGPVEVRR
jgi:hypothetical protein